MVALSPRANVVHSKPLLFRDVNILCLLVFPITKHLFMLETMAALYLCSHFKVKCVETHLVRARRHDSVLSITPIQLLTEVELGAVGGVALLGGFKFLEI